MKHSTFSSVSVTPNCFRTVVGEYGITCYYSVCVGNKLDLEEVERVNCPSYLRYQQEPTQDDIRFICIHRVVNRDITFSKTPYKQVKPKLYTQHFGFIIFKCFTSWREIVTLSRMHIDNANSINSFIYNLKHYYPNNK